MKKYLLFLLFTCIFIFSCKKNNQKLLSPPVIISNPEARNQEGTKLLGTSTRYNNAQPNFMEWTTFQYDGSTNYLTQYTDSNRNLPATDAGTGQAYIFHYDNSHVLQNISVLQNANAIFGVFNFHLNNSGLIESDSSFIGNSNFYSANSYVYNSASQIQSYSIFYTTGTVIYYYINYTYDLSGNIAQATVYDSTFNNMAKEFTATYQYDAVPNPLYAIKYINYTQFRSEGISISPNNIISFQNTDALGNPSGVDSIKFVYNSFNYPKYSIDSSTGDTTKYYYY